MSPLGGAPGGGHASAHAQVSRRLGRVLAQQRAAADRLARQLAERPDRPAAVRLRVRAHARDGPALACQCEVLQPSSSSPWMAEAHASHEAVVVLLPGKSVLVGVGSELRLFAPWHEVAIDGSRCVVSK